MINGHGDEYVGELVANFSSNVWYEADNRALYEHLHRLMHKTMRYPESDAASLKALLSHKNGIKTTEIVICNGSTEAFYLIASAYREAISLIISPTFSEYGDACKLHNHNLICTTRENLNKKIATTKPDLIWLCNPNNPDGFCYTLSELKTFLTNHPDSVFVIDQAYIEFCAEQGLSATEIHRFTNLILVQSLTKRYAIPGLRLGYFIANERIIRKISPFCIPWSVNTLAIEAGKFILEHETVDFQLTEWLKNAQTLQQNISELTNFEVVSSQTPYFLVKLLNRKASELKAYLLTEKILVRDASNFELLTGECVRICAQSSAENELLISKLKAWTPTILQ